MVHLFSNRHRCHFCLVNKHGYRDDQLNCPECPINKYLGHPCVEDFVFKTLHSTIVTASWRFEKIPEATNGLDYIISQLELYIKSYPDLPNQSTGADNLVKDMCHRACSEEGETPLTRTWP